MINIIKLNTILIFVGFFLIVGCASKPKVLVSTDGTTLNGRYFQATKNVKGKKLLLNNVGILKFDYLYLPIEILAIGLYLEEPSGDPQHIKDSSQVKHLVYQTLEYDLNEEENVEGWKRSLQKACVVECQNQVPFNELAEAVGGAVRAVGGWDITISENDSVVEINSDGKTKVIKSASLVKNIFAIYYGPNSQKYYKELGLALLSKK